MATNTEWSITLCAPGACTDCMYAYCCTPCALAQARTNLDGTSCCLNFLLGNAISMRWMIRTAYGIQGDECSDCFTTLCCPCCVVNQMYQTTKTLGDPFGPMPGAHMERGQEWASANEPCDCGSCCCACFCMYCAQGRILQDSMGMSSWMGCCCVNPCFARNMVKVHYRVGKADDDCCNDALIPCLISLPVGGIAVYPYLVYFLMQMAAETKVCQQSSDRLPLLLLPILILLPIMYILISLHRCAVSVCNPDTSRATTLRTLLALVGR